MSGRITELFNNNVFTDAEMKARLPKIGRASCRERV